MGKVTYLLGAGASANFLPVVAKMASDIDDVIDQFKTKYPSNLDSRFNVISDRLIEDLDWIAANCRTHSSIDTYAKKLYLSGEMQTYFRLKVVLSVYFTLAQKIGEKTKDGRHIDLRYDNFWASILNKANELPESIRIMSWNYDTQLEISYSNFFKDDLQSAYKKLKIMSPTDVGLELPNGFGIFKLNGSAKFRYKGNVPKYFSSEMSGGPLKDFYEEILSIYKDIQEFGELHYQLELSFSWEERKNMMEFLDKVGTSISGSKALVIIGYTFPVFNREIDKKLLSYLNNTSKIYIQSQGESVEEISDNLINVLEYPESKSIKLIRGVSQFAFPPELTV